MSNLQPINPSTYYNSIRHDFPCSQPSSEWKTLTKFNLFNIFTSLHSFEYSLILPIVLNWHRKKLCSTSSNSNQWTDGRKASQYFMNLCVRIIITTYEHAMVLAKEPRSTETTITTWFWEISSNHSPAIVSHTLPQPYIPAACTCLSCSSTPCINCNIRVMFYLYSKSKEVLL